MISINPQTFATDLLNTVDYVINGFVQAGYEHLVQNNQTAITLTLTFYIAWLGYKFMNHTLEMEINTFARHLGLLIIVYALLMQWNLFYLFFYNVFTNEPAEIAKTMIGANANVNMGGESTADALNSVFNQGMLAGKTLFSAGNVTNIPLYFYGVLVCFATGMECLVALFLLIYAKMAMALTLILAPIFILFLLFGTTREFFNKWIQKLFNYALIPVITCGILMLTLSVANVTLPGLTQLASAGNANFTGILVYVCLGFISVMLFLQVLPMCATLSGGMALAGLSLALPLAKQAAKMSGTSAVANKAGSLAGRGLSSAKNKISDGAKNLKAQRAKAARDKKFGSGSGMYY